MQWRTIERSETFVWLAGLVYYGAFLFSPEPFSGKESHAEDPMAVSGFGILICGIVVARYIQRGFPERVNALLSSGAIHMPEFDPTTFKDWFEGRAANLFMWIFVSLLGLYIVGLAATQSNPLGKIHLYLGGAMGIWMVSARFAFGVATGYAASYLSDKDSLFVLNPGHSDRSSGFGRLGYFYFDQALVLLMPAFFMLFWIIYVEINIAEIERNSEINAVFEAIDEAPPRETILSKSLEEYVVCFPPGAGYALADSNACKPDERLFFWGPHFYALIIFNLMIFLLSWGWPTLKLHVRMKSYRDDFIAHRINELERLLSHLRQNYLARLQTEPTPDVVSEMQPQMDSASSELGVYRATPVYPLPIWTALTAIISNVSAVIGLLGSAIL